MSFDIFLIASSGTPGSESFERRVKEALDRAGAASLNGVVHRLHDGSEVDIYYDAEPSVMFAVYGGRIPAALPELLFHLAGAMQMFIVPATDSGEAYRPRGDFGDPPEDFLTVREVMTADDLAPLLLG